MHYVEQSSPINAAAAAAAGAGVARLWEGRVKSTAQRVADLVQALRGAERERLIVAVEEGAGGELSVKIFQKTVCVHVCVGARVYLT